MNESTPMRSIFSGYRHTYLLVSLLLTLVVSPFLRDTGLDVPWFELLLFVNLLAGVFDSVRNRRSLVGIVSLALVAGASRFLVDGDPGSPWLFVFLGSYLCFYSAVTLVLIYQLAHIQKGINFQTLCGALSAYILFGFIWAIAYALLELAMPGSFVFNTASADTTAKFDRFLGFSFTTLTTLGYGNVVPATPQADAITTTEAIIGQIYIAVVIARLVAMEILQRREAEESGSE